jgi:hypothetical protein
MSTLGERKMRGEKRREEKNAERWKQQQTDALDAIYACEWVKERQWGKIVMAVWIEEKKIGLSYIILWWVVCLLI